jgi:hypothetical protein
MDLTKNCKIEFTEAVFTGAYTKVTYSHERKIKGIITKESYGEKTGQHTFTIEVESSDDNSIPKGKKILRKGRNVYPNCRVLEYPVNHSDLANDKHDRSNGIKQHRISIF